MMLESICPRSASLRKLLFSIYESLVEEVWTKVLLFQQNPMLKLNGVMLTIFSGSPGLGVHIGVMVRA
jgi:hypothetical protein